MATVLHFGHFGNARRPFQAATGTKSVRDDAEQSLRGKLLKEFFDILVEFLRGSLGSSGKMSMAFPRQNELGMRAAKSEMHWAQADPRAVARLFMKLLVAIRL